MLYFTGEERHVFNVDNYTTGCWSSLSPSSPEILTEESDSSDSDESRSESEDKTEALDQNLVAVEDET